MISRQEWTWSKRLTTATGFALAATVWWFIAEPLFHSEAAITGAGVIRSSPYLDLLVYSLAFFMPWIGLGCAIFAGLAWPAKYRSVFVPALAGYIFLLVLFSALVYLQ